MSEIRQPPYPAATTRQAMATAQRRLAVLTVILLLAAALRTINILQQSIWLDEGFVYHAVTQPTVGDMIPVLASDAHPPLYFLLMRGWVAVAGDSVLALRYFSVLPGMLSVAMIFPLARELGRFSPRQDRWAVAALATLLLALADVESFLSQEARMYTLRTLLAEVSVLAYLHWLRTSRRGWAACWVLSTTALLYTHYLGLFIPLIEGLHALLFQRGRVRLLALGLLTLSGMLFAPWFLAVGLDQVAAPSYVIGAIPSTWQTLLDLRNRYFSGQWALMLALALLGTGAVVTAGGRTRFRWRPADAAFLLLLWLALPVVVTFVGNLWRPMLSERRISLIAPAIALLVGRGLGNLRQPARVFLVAVIVVYGLTTVDYYQFKIPWNKIAGDMVRYARPGDLALLEVWTSDYALAYYLDHWLPEGVPYRSLRQWRDAVSSGEYNGGLLALLNEHPHVWLAHWGSRGYTLDQLASLGYTRTATLTTDHFGTDFNVYRYDRLPQEPLARFTSGMVLRDARLYAHPLRVDLWWSAPQPLAIDYSVSAFLLDEAGRLVAQRDSYPFADARPTTSWQPGEVVYDPRPLAPEDLPPGRYTVGVKVYTWYDGTIFPTVDGEEWVAVGTIER